MGNKRIIVGVSGASGVAMAEHLLRALNAAGGLDIHLIVSESARLTWELEVGRPVDDLLALATHVHDEKDFAAVIASGSYVTEGMIVVPCSMKSLAGVASGYADNLLLRAVDVCLKENRRVVLVPREMPFGKVHLRNMATAADLGCAIVPPMLTFYNASGDLTGQIHHVVGKILMQFGLEYPAFKPWQGA